MKGEFIKKLVGLLRGFEEHNLAASLLSILVQQQFLLKRKTKTNKQLSEVTILDLIRMHSKKPYARTIKPNKNRRGSEFEQPSNFRKNQRGLGYYRNRQELRIRSDSRAWVSIWGPGNGGFGNLVNVGFSPRGCRF